MRFQGLPTGAWSSRKVDAAASAAQQSLQGSADWKCELSQMHMEHCEIDGHMDI